MKPFGSVQGTFAKNCGRQLPLRARATELGRKRIDIQFADGESRRPFDEEVWNRVQPTTALSNQASY